MVVLNYLTTLTHLRNSRFWWEDSEISQNAMAFIANMSEREIVEISHLTIHET